MSRPSPSASLAGRAEERGRVSDLSTVSGNNLDCRAAGEPGQLRWVCFTAAPVCAAPASAALAAGPAACCGSTVSTATIYRGKSTALPRWKRESSPSAPEPGKHEAAWWFPETTRSPSPHVWHCPPRAPGAAGTLQAGGQGHGSCTSEAARLSADARRLHEGFGAGAASPSRRKGFGAEQPRWAPQQPCSTEERPPAVKALRYFPPATCSRAWQPRPSPSWGPCAVQLRFPG